MKANMSSLKCKSGITMPKYTHVIWDWNGTLFDDVGWCISVINKMLAKRSIKTLDSAEAYHKVFCFPIIKYYTNIGFDFEKEPFEALAKEFISLYHSEQTGGCKLNSHAEAVLERLRRANISQIILSASETGLLLSQVGGFDIIHYFDALLGLSDIYAKSKIDIGLEYMAGKGIENAVLIGDTEHDYETAKALGADCLLVAVGHQSRERLLKCGVPVMENLTQTADYICGSI